MRRRNLATTAALVVVLGWFVHFWPGFHTANESIRIYFMQALVDYGTATVDPVLKRYKTRNVDAAEFDGHAYLDKAPGLSLALVPAYWFGTRVLNLPTGYRDLPPLGYLLLFLGVILPCTAAILLVRDLARDLPGTGSWEVALAFGLGTPFFIYATLLFGHAPATACAVLSLWAVFKQRPALAGAAAGMMVLTDTPTALLALVLLGVLAWRARQQSTVRVTATWLEPALRFVLGALPFAAVQLGYNTWLFGGPLDFAYGHKANADLAAIHGQGLFGFRVPTTDALYGLFLSARRGLFFHAPVLLLGVVGLVTAWRSADPARRLWAQSLTLPALVYGLAIGGFVDWPAGDSYGPRHLIPIIPFLALGLIGLPSHAAWRWALAATGGIGLAMALIPIASFPYAPDSYAFPVAQLAVPMLRDGITAPNVLGLTSVTGSLAGIGLALLVLGLLAFGPGLRALGVLGGVALVVGVTLSVGPRSKADVERAILSCIVGRPELGTDVCVEGYGWDPRRCACRRLARPSPSPPP